MKGMRLALALLLVVSAPMYGSCLANGHYTMVASPAPLTGTPFPYTEDLAWRSESKPIGDPVTVAYHDDLRWTKIQTGCADFGERNIVASVEVNLLLRASFSLSNANKGVAATGARYEVQLRLGDEVIASEVRRLDGRYPQAQRFGAVAERVPAGAHVYSMWLRLLDGPGTVTLGLLWITAQGVPSSYPSVRGAVAEAQDVTTEWTPIGPELRLVSQRILDLELVASMTIAAADPDARLEVTFGDKRGVIAPPPVLPSSVTLFDHRTRMKRGAHPIQLFARSTKGTIRVENVRVGAMALPWKLGRIVPLHEASADAPIEVTPAGSDPQPETMSPICGRWTKILEWDTHPSDGDFSWAINGYVELLDVVGSGYVEIAVQAVRSKVDPDGQGSIERTDMGTLPAQLTPGGDGVWFYGDCSAWANTGGTHMSLWMRIVEGCNDAPFGGVVRVGSRRVAIKLLPSSNVHLP